MQQEGNKGKKRGQRRSKRRIKLQYFNIIIMIKTDAFRQRFLYMAHKKIIKKQQQMNDKLKT